MSALKPGLYRATVNGTDRVGLLDFEGDFNYLNDAGRVHCLRTVTDARPLIILDLEDPAEFVRILRGIGIRGKQDQPLADGSFEHIINGSISAKRLSVIADQIEAQTKPARIAEPGLWGVVGSDGYRWVRFHNGDNHWGNSRGQSCTWGDLIDPALIREGVTE